MVVVADVYIAMLAIVVDLESDPAAGTQAVLKRPSRVTLVWHNRRMLHVVLASSKACDVTVQCSLAIAQQCNVLVSIHHAAHNMRAACTQTPRVVGPVGAAVGAAEDLEQRHERRVVGRVHAQLYVAAAAALPETDRACCRANAYVPPSRAFRGVAVLRAAGRGRQQGERARDTMRSASRPHDRARSAEAP